jgi:hypothetical protein
LENYKSQGKAVGLTLNSKEENSSDFCLDFFQEFGLWTVQQYFKLLSYSSFQAYMGRIIYLYPDPYPTFLTH